MERRWFALITGGLACVTALLILLSVRSGPGFATSLSVAPIVREVEPSTAPNDLDTPVVITGTDFTAVPTVYLGSTLLEEVTWLSSTRLTAIVPWGLLTGTYPLTVVNPGGEWGSLADAFTVTQGLGVWTTGGPYGGEIWHVALHPLTPTQVYASADCGGIFLSDDAAARWELMFLYSLAAGQLAFDAQAPQIVYCANGQAHRTLDSGHTWEYLGLPDPHLQEFHIVAHPISTGIAYAGSSAPDYRPVDPGEEGILYRLEDWGDSWITITTGLTDTHVTAIAIHPEDPDRVLVGTRHGHLFVSRDGGDSWQWAAQPSSHIGQLYFNPLDSREAWAVTMGPVTGTDPPYLFRSLDPDLTTWLPVTVTVHSGVFSLAFHPTLSDTLWAAGGGVCISTDGGDTWTPLASTPPEVMTVAVDPHDTDVMYAGTRHYGLFKSADGGTTWHEANEGLAGIVPSYLAVPPPDPYQVYAYAHTLGLIKSNNGGGSWRTLDVLRCGVAWPRHPLASDPFSATHLYLGESWVPDCGPGPQEDALPAVRSSPDGGETWQVVTLTVPSEIGDWSGDTYVVAPDPSQAGRLLAGVTFFPPDFDWSSIRYPLGGIYVSDDWGEHWSQITLTQPISGVIQIVFTPSDPQIVFAATGGTGLWKSTDGGLAWQAISSWTGSQDIYSLAVHPLNPDVVYVTASDSVYRTIDGGLSWTDLQLDPNEYAPLFFAPTEPPILYAGGCCGAKSSSDGQTWEEVPGIPREATVRAFAAGRVDGRVVVYAAMSGGITPIEGQAATASDPIPGLGSILGGGVYRFTSLQPGHWLYLPIIVRSSQ